MSHVLRGRVTAIASSGGPISLTVDGFVISLDGEVLSVAYEAPADRAAAVAAVRRFTARASAGIGAPVQWTIEQEQSGDGVVHHEFKDIQARFGVVVGVAASDARKYERELDCLAKHPFLRDADEALNAYFRRRSVTDLVHAFELVLSNAKAVMKSERKDLDFLREALAKHRHGLAAMAQLPENECA